MADAMKQLGNKEYILSRIYYYLLDFKDTDTSRLLESISNKDSLYRLTKKEILEYFDKATSIDK
jgi:hypothetical protein